MPGMWGPRPHPLRLPPVLGRPATPPPRTTAAEAATASPQNDVPRPRPGDQNIRRHQDPRHHSEGAGRRRDSSHGRPASPASPASPSTPADRASPASQAHQASQASPPPRQTRRPDRCCRSSSPRVGTPPRQQGHRRSRVTP